MLLEILDITIFVHFIRFFDLDSVTIDHGRTPLTYLVLTLSGTADNLN